MIKNYLFSFTVTKEPLSPGEITAEEQRKQESVIEPAAVTRVKITKEQYSNAWPFTIKEAILGCAGAKGLGTVLLITENKVYAVNGTIAGRTYKGQLISNDMTEIRDIFKDIKPILKHGLDLCP